MTFFAFIFQINIFTSYHFWQKSFYRIILKTQKKFTHFVKLENRVMYMIIVFNKKKQS